MASQFVHLSFAYHLVSGDTIADACRTAFLLGALAPDIVASHRDKRRTHYSVHVGITWGYRFRAFEQAFVDFGDRSPAHRWFRDGYRHHLCMDDLWMRTCGHRALFRMAPRLLIGQKAVLAAYYGELSALDNYVCARSAPGLAQAGLAHLQCADLDLLPPWIERELARDGLAQAFRRARNAEAFQALCFEGRYIRRQEAERFLRGAADIPIV